jgi:hypothetical protein
MNLLAPVGGWLKCHTFTTATQAIRDMFSWRDSLKHPWMSCGSADKLFSQKVISNASFTTYDITPAGLVWSLLPMVGYGSDAYGEGPYGYETPNINPDDVGMWSLDNFGRLLIAVHTQDGRLFSWDPVTPATIAAPVTGAPIDNTLVICTDERHIMLLGGKNNPRRVAWCSKEDMNDWTVTEENSAGGFDLQSNGAIISAIKLSGGILVLCDTDAHIIEYVGSPYFYSRRRISEESTCLGKNCLTGYPQGAMWVGAGNFWKYDGAISKVECDLHGRVFYNSNLSKPSRLTLFTNQYNQEIWFSFPNPGSSEPNFYVAHAFGAMPHWTYGDIPRTAWLNPVWTNRPYACNGKDLYQHEVGWTADGVSRANTVFAESGVIELEDGTNVARIDRLYPDFGQVESPIETRSHSDAITMSFKLRQAPDAPERIKGPYQLDNPKGYVNLRFRARQMQVRIDQQEDNFWVVGKMRVRTKASGKR